MMPSSWIKSRRPDFRARLSFRKSTVSDSRPIGVFDSGMGGLTVLAELKQALPHENFIYLGDTARVPYGSKSPRVIRRYSLEVSRRLLEEDIKFLVIACNTASAHAVEQLRQELSIPVQGVIEPGAAALVQLTRTGRVGVVGTRSTIKSGAYAAAIARRNQELKVFSRACPLFVPLVEEGWMDKRITGLTVQEYLSEMVREEVDTVVLGCTHYPLLKNAIHAEFPDLKLVDSSVETAMVVSARLQKENLLGPVSGEPGLVRILLTDVTDQMERLEKLFLGLSFQSVEEVQLLESLS